MRGSGGAGSIWISDLLQVIIPEKKPIAAEENNNEKKINKAPNLVFVWFLQ